MSPKATPTELKINAASTSNGINIEVNGEDFPITYDSGIWARVSPGLKERLCDTMAMAATLYIPQMLGLKEAHYATARPISECFFLRNGIYDAPYCAEVDGKSTTQYLKSFFNTRYLFADETIKTPTSMNVSLTSPKGKRALILFSFGKESLLSFALCKELGIEPVLATIIHPGFLYEWEHKKPLVEQFSKEFGIQVHTIDYQPGLLKEGKHWGLKTELGWGLHVTEYALLALPLAEIFNCDMIVCGNEQSCNDIYYDKEDVLIYRAGLDQHREWTAQQGLLQSLLMGRSLPAVSLLDPLYEIAETKILHARFPEIGKYQMSCFASGDGAESRRWCQRCEKCAYMYTLFRAFGIDPRKVGFTDDLFDENHSRIFAPFFSRTEETHFYGNQGELALAFLAILARGEGGFTVDRFKSELYERFSAQKTNLISKYMGIHKTSHYPKGYESTLNKIFEEELSNCLAL